MFDEKKIYVLLIEDDEDDYIITQDLLLELPHAKYHLDWVTNLEDAKSKLEERSFDVCLCDYRLGSENGLDFLKYAVQNYPRIPVVMLTGQDDLETDNLALKIGATDYLVKGQINSTLLGRAIRYSIEQIRDRERIRKSESELQKSNATKDKFFSIIAHDLRSPFTALLSLSDILLEHFGELDDETKKEYIGMIQESSENTFKLIENLLEWSRVQRGTIEINPEQFRLAGMVRRILNLHKQIADNKGIEMQHGIDETETVYADPNMVETVIRNLVLNAIKFTGRDGWIRVDCERTDGMTRIQVKDNGTGMDEKTMGKLFNIEENKSTPGTDGETGTGLGLILCREFVAINRGDIDVESEPGKGSIFTVTLPSGEEGSQVQPDPGR
ncbi:MAG: ATP-binding protein [Bacteroidales bacterium]